MADSRPGEGTQQGALETEYFLTSGFMAFGKLLATCGVNG